MQSNCSGFIPDEVAKAEHHTRELNDAGQVGIERFNEVGKHGRERQRTEALSEGDCCEHGHGGELPLLAPILDGH